MSMRHLAATSISGWFSLGWCEDWARADVQAPEPAAVACDLIPTDGARPLTTDEIEDLLRSVQAVEVSLENVSATFDVSIYVNTGPIPRRSPWVDQFRPVGGSARGELSWQRLEDAEQLHMQYDVPPAAQRGVLEPRTVYRDSEIHATIWHRTYQALIEPRTDFLAAPIPHDLLYPARLRKPLGELIDLCEGVEGFQLGDGLSLLRIEYLVGHQPILIDVVIDEAPGTTVEWRCPEWRSRSVIAWEALDGDALVPVYMCNTVLADQRAAEIRKPVEFETIDFDFGAMTEPPMLTLPPKTGVADYRAGLDLPPRTYIVEPDGGVRMAPAVSPPREIPPVARVGVWAGTIALVGFIALFRLHQHPH